MSDVEMVHIEMPRGAAADLWYEVQNRIDQIEQMLDIAPQGWRDRATTEFTSQEELEMATLTTLVTVVTALESAGIGPSDVRPAVVEEQGPTLSERVWALPRWTLWQIAEDLKIQPGPDDERVVRVVSRLYRDADGDSEAAWTGLVARYPEIGEVGS